MLKDLSTYQWFAIYTKYKCEKYVVEQLKKKGIEAYIPLIKKTRQYTRKIKTYQIPLINCYAFVKIRRDQYKEVLSQPYVIHFVKIQNDIAAIPEKEINLMKRIVGEKFDIEMMPSSWAKGDVVEIIAGNLTGLKGKLIAQAGKCSFIVELETLGFDIRITIDDSLIRKVQTPAMV